MHPRAWRLPRNQQPRGRGEPNHRTRHMGRRGGSEAVGTNPASTNLSGEIR